MNDGKQSDGKWRCLKIADLLWRRNDMLGHFACVAAIKPCFFYSAGGHSRNPAAYGVTYP